jgi:uncharacterized protein Yka (UPF0111/DUF47 family)
VVSWLFPDERRFFDDFSAIAASLTTVATLLEQGLDQPARLSETVAAIDRVVANTDAAAHELDLHMDQLFIPPMDRVLARLVVRASREIEAAVRNIRTGDDVLARCREIKRTEEEGDAAWETAVEQLFAGTPDPIDVIRWKALYDQLEDTLDACDDVANELETITVKHA